LLDRRHCISVGGLPQGREQGLGFAHAKSLRQNTAPK
jgi:hypothetical protein